MRTLSVAFQRDFNPYPYYKGPLSNQILEAIPIVKFAIWSICGYFLLNGKGSARYPFLWLAVARCVFLYDIEFNRSKSSRHFAVTDCHLFFISIRSEGILCRSWRHC